MLYTSRTRASELSLAMLSYTSLPRGQFGPLLSSSNSGHSLANTTSVWQALISLSGLARQLMTKYRGRADISVHPMLSSTLTASHIVAGLMLITCNFVLLVLAFYHDPWPAPPVTPRIWPAPPTNTASISNAASAVSTTATTARLS